MTSVVFMGTPDFSVPILEALIQHYSVIGVVTQPDRPAGRGGKIRISPIKEIAIKHSIPVFQPEKLRKKSSIEALQQWKPDIYVVAAFGQILPQVVLDIPAYGSINVHASLLPRWRGAAPIHAAIRSGDAETGITIMKMDAGLDTGPMISQRAIPIEADETAQSLHDKLAELGANLLIETMPGYLSGEFSPQAQPEEGITYAPQISKEEGVIDWERDTASIERLVRAFTPWPGTFTFFRGKQLKILGGYTGEGNLKAGSVQMLGNQVVIGTGQGVFCPTEVQLAGKKATPITSFVNGYPDFIGTTLPDGI